MNEDYWYGQGKKPLVIFKARLCFKAYLELSSSERDVGEAGLLLRCAEPRGRTQGRGCAAQGTGRERTTGSWALGFLIKPPISWLFCLCIGYQIPSLPLRAFHTSSISHYRRIEILASYIAAFPSGEGLTAISEKGWLTPRPRKASMGITFSWAMHCRILGAPYSPPMQEARDEMYSPSKNKKPTKDTWRKWREDKVDDIVLYRAVLNTCI